MTKGALLGELANLTEMKKADISKVLNTLTEIGTQEVKKSGKFVLPGLCMIKTRTKAAVKGGGTRMMFGKEVKIRPQPAKTGREGIFQCLSSKVKSEAMVDSPSSAMEL